MIWFTTSQELALTYNPSQCNVYIFQTYLDYKPVCQNRVKEVTENRFASGIHRAQVLLQTLWKLSSGGGALTMLGMCNICTNHKFEYMQCVPIMFICAVGQ